MSDADLYKKAYEVLTYNDLGKWTRPAPDLYPHQWLWDSCFIAIGLAHEDPERAKQEILSLFRGQWSNGMIPHMIFTNAKSYHKRPEFWNSRISPYSPHKLETSGITQPPLLAEAVVHIGKQMKKDKRVEFYNQVFPRLLAYHEWFYRERDPHTEGLVLLIHPWETGLDNTPPWIEEMKKHQKPWWIRTIEILRIDSILEKIRRDTRQVAPEERASTIESLMLFNIVRRLRRKQYDTERILLRSHFLMEDVFLNSILIRANSLLEEIAHEIHAHIPTELQSAFNRASKALEKLWNEEKGMYFSRNFVTRHSNNQPTIATLLPLYSGSVSKARAKHLVEMLKNEHLFGTKYPVPSVPLNSSYFNHRRYWQGPSWMNTNWLIIEGLKRYGYKEEAELLRTSSLGLVDKAGFHEYFSPIDGFGAGIQPFSWTAALVMDLAKSPIKK